MTERPDLKERFWSKVSDTDTGGCRLWLGARHYSGYGHFKLNGRAVESHRVSFWLTHSRAPNGFVMHKCDNRACVEPTHLTEGSHRDNMADCAAKRRNRTPRPGNGRVKLTPPVREEIRAKFLEGGVSKHALAREYRVSATRIRQVVNGAA